ncbi:MAG: outer membrane protein assembly factor BamA [Planctomycetes bacterium]|nr:outer membrane protein assembly factor BamA [Planctomycetota bacterium]
MTRLAHTLLRLVVLVSSACALHSCGLLRSARVLHGVEVRYEGNAAFDTGDLDDVLKRFYKDFESARLKKSAVDDAADDIERAYLAAGHPRVAVTYTYDGDAVPKPLAVFHIVEGPHVEFDSVTFQGATAFTRKELEAFFAPPVSGLLEESRSDYVEASVNSAADELELAYTTKGYLQARVVVADTDFGHDGTRAVVHVSIHEGPLCRLNSLIVEGADESVPRAALDAVRNEFVGQPYYERLSVTIQGRLEELHAQLGFGDVRATRTGRLVHPDGRVELAFSVQPGPRITVGTVAIRGNEATGSEFIRSRLALRDGELYSREKERTSFARLFRSGIFDRVNIRTVVPPDEDTSSGSVVRDVQVEVRESPAIEMFIEPGWGSYEELRLAAGARHRNLFGSGRILDFHGVVASKAQSGALSLIDPWLFESDVVAEVSLFGNRREEPSFLRLETGIGTTFTRRFSRTIDGSVGYRLRSSRATDVQILDAEALAALDQVNISEFQGAFAHDTRDSVFQPTQGSISKIAVEYGSALFGSELDFLRLKTQVATFVPLNSATVLGISAKLGYLQPLGGTDSFPLQERFFNGGENTVRSFRESELGPKDSEGEPIGGEAFTTFSAELRRRLRGRLEGAVFFDIGNVTPDHNDFFDFAGYSQAIGVGLRYSLPVGPIRFDVATNPDPGEFEARFVAHLSLGMSF